MTGQETRPARSRPQAPRVCPDRRGPVHVELIAVGRELLQGRIHDANGPLLAGSLTRRGALVRRITVVDDTELAVAAAVREALDRQPHLVVTTGGLGPAGDDCTLAGVSEALRLPLAASAPARRMVEEAYERLRASGRVAHGGMTATREKSCSIPVGSEPIPNPVGVAPGVLVRLTGGAQVLCLPGNPEEAQAVFDAAASRLDSLGPQRPRAVREVEAPNADESVLRPLLDKLSDEYPMVRVKSHAPGFKRRKARIVVSLEASAEKKEDAESAVEGALRRLLALAAGIR